MSTIQKNKEITLKFLKEVVSGKIDEAYEKYVDMHGKHHNVFNPAGFEALKKGMKENHMQFPNKEIHIKQIICEEDLVAAHSHVILKKAETEINVVHILKFRNDKIIEMWDCGQVLQPNSPNKEGAF